MRKLQRPGAPAVLEELTRRGATWSGVTRTEKKLIRRPLEAMSMRGKSLFCNYCESKVQPARGHIEHLTARASDPALEFVWGNLFLSCDSNAHCGHFKDSSRGVAYSPDLVIHPDVDDPDNFLQFFSSGEVQPRQGLDPGSQTRALTTIQALNLNDPDLVQARAGLARQARAMVFDYLDSIEALTPTDRAELFADEIAAFAGSPFFTTVRQFFIEG